MKLRYRLFNHHGTFYWVDSQTGKQQSLRTKNREEAEILLAAKNESGRQPKLNFHIARVYLSAADESYASRTWQTVIDSMMRMRKGPDLHRWRSVAKDKALEFLWSRPLIETNAEDLLRALEEGTVSTNVFLRRMHNYALDMNWLPLPIIPRKRWPKITHQDKRAITLDEHTRIIERELNPERKAFYQLAWHLGTSQTDLANLQAEDIDWTDKKQALEEAIVALSRRYPTEGYKKIAGQLRAQGYRVNKKQVQRVRRQGLSTGLPQQASHRNYVWAWDFVSDYTQRGGKLRVLTLIDECTRQCHGLYADRTLTAADVLKVLERQIEEHGAPQYIRSDNGPEFIAKIIQQWLKDNGIKTTYIDPGCPWQNGYAESFNSRFRVECLDREVIYTLSEGRVVFAD